MISGKIQGLYPYIGLLCRIAWIRPRFILGPLIVLVVLLAAVFAPWLSRYSPIEANPERFLEPSSWEHYLGTDSVGMDIFTRSLYAPRIDLTIAVVSTIISAVIGSILGALAGFYSGIGKIASASSYLLMRATDVLQAFPVFVFAIALVASFGLSLKSLVAAIAFVNIPIYLRLMRSQVLSLRSMRFIEAARVAGVSDFYIITRHIIPNAIAPVLAQTSINIGWAILLTAGLSFVGAGVRPPTPEWGSMIASGFQNVVTGQWWPSVYPGIALAVTVFGFALVGSSVEVFVDPLKRRALIAECYPDKKSPSLPTG